MRGVLMHDARAQGVHDQLMRWADEAQWIFQEGPSIGDSVGQVKFWRRGRLEEGRVEASVDVDLGQVVAHSADQLDAPMPELKGRNGYPVLARQVACTWHVCPPVLSANAKERKKPVKDSDKGSNKERTRLKRSSKARIKVKRKWLMTFLCTKSREGGLWLLWRSRGSWSWQGKSCVKWGRVPLWWTGSR